MEGFVKRSLICFLLVLMSGVLAFAANDEREAERVKDAGEVMKEILNIPTTFRRICWTRRSAWSSCPR